MRLDKEEEKLLGLMSNEKDHHEIAEEMKLTIKEVHKIIDNLMQKLEVKTEVGLVKNAIKRGIIEND